MVLGYPIDWAATGSMLSGWGTLLGAFAVAYAAKTGVDTFTSWKVQKLEERRIDLAEKILEVTNKSFGALRFVRNPFQTAKDLEDARIKLGDGYANDKAVTAQVILNRLLLAKDDLFAPREFAVLADAYFSGKAIGDDFRKLNDLSGRVRNAAFNYGNLPLDYPDTEFRAKLESELWYGNSDPDEMDVIAEDCRKRIEDVMHDVLTHT